MRKSFPQNLTLYLTPPEPYTGSYLPDDSYMCQKGMVVDTTASDHSIALRWRDSYLSRLPKQDLVDVRLSLVDDSMPTTPEYPSELAIPNTPLTGLRVLGVEHRKYSSVLKVVTRDSVMFDMHPEIYLEAAFHAGTDSGGFLRGEYVWYFYNTQRALVRVGSKLHAALKDKPHRTSRHSLFGAI